MCVPDQHPSCVCAGKVLSWWSRRTALDQILDFEHPGLVKEAHASRLKFYADKDLDVTSDLLAHLAHDDQGYEVKASGDAPWNEVKKVYEIDVKWRGFVVCQRLNDLCALNP
jgi:hypothetical protein